MFDRLLKPVGYQQITSLSAATGLTIPSNATKDPAKAAKAALIIAETQSVRWRDDGVDPTASVGMPLPTGAPGIFYTGDLSAIKFIETTTSAKLNVTYYA